MTAGPPPWQGPQQERNTMSGFRNSTVYQIYIKSFCDSNGDGIGDLNGIRSKLDYLKTLGIDYIWITPFFKSPMNDNGYEGDPKYMDYYIFRDPVDGHAPTNWVSKFGGNAWEYVPSLGKYYLHLFDVSQADLNWENPAVREELKNVIRFWKEKGVRGFRFDVVNLISKPDLLEDDFIGDGRRFYTDGPRIHQHLKELVGDTGIAEMMTVGEMSSTSLDNCVRYANPIERELKMVFSFHHLKVDYKGGEKWALMDPDFGALRDLFRKWQEGMQEGGAWNALFWCNHDQPRAVSRFGDDGKYWKESAKMLGVLIHLMRGTPYIYQGEEIGMTNAGYTSIDQYGDVESTNYFDILCKEGKTPEEALHIIGERSRDNGRTPMQWDGSEMAGFTTGTPWLSIPANHTYINVAAEEQDPDSILAFYKKLVQLRKENEIIADGGIRFLDTGTSDVIAYERTLGGEKLTVYCNLRGYDVPVQGLSEFAGGEILVCNYASAGEGGVLRPFEARAIRS